MDYQDNEQFINMRRETRNWIIIQMLQTTVALKKIPEDDIVERNVLYAKLKDLYLRLEYEEKHIIGLLDRFDEE